MPMPTPTDEQPKPSTTGDAAHKTKGSKPDLEIREVEAGEGVPLEAFAAICAAAAAGRPADIDSRGLNIDARLLRRLLEAIGEAAQASAPDDLGSAILGATPARKAR